MAPPLCIIIKQKPSHSQWNETVITYFCSCTACSTALATTVCTLGSNGFADNLFFFLLKNKIAQPELGDTLLFLQVLIF